MEPIVPHPGSIVVVVLACVGLSSRLAGQAQTLLSEDFENGAPGWTMTTEPCSDVMYPGPPLWHISDDGECGALTRMASYSRYPLACDYSTGDFCNAGQLTSPVFALLGNPPFTLEFDYTKDMGESFDNGLIWVVDPAEGLVGWIHNLVSVLPNTATIQHARVGLPCWATGRQVWVGFWVDHSPYAAPAAGWRIDNVLVTDSGRPVPVVSAISPDHGANLNSPEVTITGSGFLGATAVFFGPNAALFTVDSDTQIRANFNPVTTTGFVDVSVSRCSATGVLAGAFDFFRAPREVGAACSAPRLAWAGSPTLGQTYTVTTENLGADNQILLVQWSTGQRVPHLASVAHCSIYLRPDQTIALGNSSSYSFSIPSDPALVGAHLLTQAKVLRTPVVTSQVLDATIGE